MILSMCSLPEIFLCSPVHLFILSFLFFIPRYKISCISVDLPEPETPVKQTKRRKGISTSIFFKLCSLAPVILIFGLLDLTFLLCAGRSMFFSFLKYCPVKDFSAEPWVLQFSVFSGSDFLLRRLFKGP